MKSILITGGTGLVGKKLLSKISKNVFNIYVLTRKKSFKKDGINYLNWNPSIGRLDISKIKNLDTIIHLVGESIAKKRWTNKQKEIILNSRIITTQLLFKEINKMKTKPQSIISASAVGIYKSNTLEPQVENDHLASDFLSNVVMMWEKEINKFKSLGIRTVILRIGIVISKDGGMIKRLLPIFRYGLGVPIGSGVQLMSWIHIDDLVRIILHCQINNKMHGYINAVSPYPVTNNEFTLKFSKILNGFHFPSFIKAPVFIIKILFGEMSDLIINGKNISANKILKSNFSFLYEKLDEALIDILKKNNS